MPTFAQDIKTFCTKTGLKQGDVLRKIAMDGLRHLVLKSPVDTGRFRGNWRVGVNTIDPKFSWAQKDKQGFKAIVAGTKKIANAKWGDTVYITNNTIYGNRLEHGHSKKQAPNGFLRITLIALRNAFRDAVGFVAGLKGSQS